MDDKPLFSITHTTVDRPHWFKRFLQWLGFYRPHFSDEAIEEIIYVDKKGEDYVRDMYHEGIFVGIEIQRFISKKEADEWYGQYK